MNNLIISINVIMPLFITIMLGYFIRKINLIDENTVKVMNDVTFKVFLSAFVFNNIYNTDLGAVFNAKLIIFAVISVLLICISMCIFIPLIEKDNRKRGVLIQTIFRSNFILFGLPITVSLFGEKSSGIPSLLIAIIIPIFNLLAVIVLEIFKGENIDNKKIVRGIATNPLILGCLLGIIMVLLEIKLPIILKVVINDLSKVATPLALIILGASFKFKKIREYKRQLLIGVIGRLIIIPSIFMPIAIALNFKEVELATIMVLMSAPTAVSSFTMAEQVGADGDLAGQLIIFTSAFSVITMFIWIFLMKQFGYI